MKKLLLKVTTCSDSGKSNLLFILVYIYILFNFLVLSIAAQISVCQEFVYFRAPIFFSLFRGILIIVLCVYLLEYSQNLLYFFIKKKTKNVKFE